MPPSKHHNLSLITMRSLSLLLLLLLPFIVSVSCQKQVYIVYFGEHSGDKTHEEILDFHLSYLFSLKSTEEEARASLLYSYKHSINGFAAVLTSDEAAALSQKEEVMSVFPSRQRSMQTTRSWNFLGLNDVARNIGEKFDRKVGKGVLHGATYGKDVIVGMLDSGVWPESQSFNDEGFGPVPKKWKGICQSGDAFNSSHCNRKIIGARYYLTNYEMNLGPLNRSNDFQSPRDHDGHGTHTTSTLGGRKVQGASALGGAGSGTASGGAPLVRLAIYKVCWPQEGLTLQEGNTCFDADMLRAMDDGIADGVDIFSISIGPSQAHPYDQDGIALGALHAVKNNIVVSCAGGNNGPYPGTITNTAPWIITVGASTVDRSFPSPVLLGNGTQVEGKSVAPYHVENKIYPLVYAGDVVLPNVPKNSSAGQCLPDSLDPSKTKGKIVLCFRGEGSRVKKGLEVQRAGGAAILLGNSPLYGNEIVMDTYVLPGTALTADEAKTIFDYIKSTKNPTAQLPAFRTELGIKPAPSMANFSSTGPNQIDSNIIKPDITAPGVDILAAWSEAISPTKLDSDHRVSPYNFDSGTSMACPHVSAAAALVKAIHPTWSNAAIRSALMTTASTINNQRKQITTASGETGNPFNYGSGHLEPTKAWYPGLVYDASYTDYLLYLCANDYRLDATFTCPQDPPSSSDLNYPSLAVSNLNSTRTVKRTVTNVGASKSLYIATVIPPHGVHVEIHPKILYFRHLNEKKSFNITLKPKEGVKQTKGEYVFGSYWWSNGVHVVKSPIAASLA